jgi:hypothetical protein
VQSLLTMNSSHRRLLSLQIIVALCLCSICASPLTTRGADYPLAVESAVHADNTSSGVPAMTQPPSAARLLNISTRARILAGDNVLIGGFIVTGSGTKRVLVRGIGPSLSAAGIQGALADPVLELHKPDGRVVTNDDWSSARADIRTTGMAPTNDKESAIVAEFAAGNYTVILRGKNMTSGIGLVEVYDLNTTAPAQLVNISSRGFVETGDNVLIGGIIVGPNGSTSSKLLLRAIGPSLTRAGIADPLFDPTLELHNGNGTLITANNDWKDTQRAAIQATGVAPTSDKESAILFNTAPGNYSVIVRGRNNTTGVALVEVYNLH